MSTDVQIFAMNGTNKTVRAHEDIGLLDHGNGVLAATTRDLFYDNEPIRFESIAAVLAFPTPIAAPNNGKTLVIKWAGRFTPIRYSENNEPLSVTLPNGRELITTEEGRVALTHQQVARQVRFKEQQSKLHGTDVQELVFKWLGLGIAAAVVITVLLMVALIYGGTQ